MIYHLRTEKTTEKSTNRSNGGDNDRPNRRGIVFPIDEDEDSCERSYTIQTERGKLRELLLEEFGSEADMDRNSDRKIQ